MNKKLLIPIFIFVLGWNLLIFSFNDSQYRKEEPPELAKSDNVSGNEALEEMLTVYNHVSKENLHMTSEEYLICVLSAEMPISYGLEALKAQAVAARTYTIYCMNKGREQMNDADVCTDYRHCQAFKSMDKVRDELTYEQFSLVARAVKETHGEVLTYNGEVINAVYHASSKDKTESAENVWGANIPYLVSVDSPDEDSMHGFRSEVVISEEEFYNKLKIRGYDTSGYENAKLKTALNQSGRVSGVRLTNGNGKALNIPGTEIRNIFSLRSCTFEVIKEEGKVKFDVCGYGHGVGMSQYGAKIMAQDGKSYQDILKHYYSGCIIEKRNF